MPYSINRYNGTLVATVEDGTVDNTLDIKLIGRNYAGYGEVQNENFVHLLENFANTTPPSRRISGQVWYDSASKKLKFYDGDKFKTTGGAEVATDEPSGLTTGDFWYKSDTNQLYAWSGSSFTLIGPQVSVGQGQTELKSIIVRDAQGQDHAVIQGLVDQVTVFLISNDAFEISQSDDIAQNTSFTRLKSGFNLIGTNLDEQSANFGVTVGNYKYWGTASSSLNLQDENNVAYSVNDFVLKNSPSFSGNVSFDDDGLTVGDQDDIKFFIEDNNATFEHVTDDKYIVFKTKLSSDTTPTNTLRLQGGDVLPGQHQQTNLGRSSDRFQRVYAIDFYGTLKGTADFAATVRVDADKYWYGATGADANTIATRDANGDITANQFLGEASRALDLAGGSAGQLAYQSQTNVTSFLPGGVTDQVLAWSAAGIPSWKSLSDLVAVGQANQVEVSANNLANQDYFIPFTSTSSGYQYFKVDTNVLTYNPTTNTLTTGIFSGTANSAKYADLAEKYLADAEYPVGTVLMVGGEKEVTACAYGRRAIGVVSAKPAYLMNSELEGGVAVALKGRVPVRVVGPVVKGNRLVGGENGLAQATMTAQFDVFAIALETSKDPGEKVIECLVL